MAKRSIGKPFEKGRSGNPGGRPKVIEPIRDLAREHGAEALATLVGIVRDEAQPCACRVAAAREVLDRGFGRPAQTILGDGVNPIFVRVTTGVTRSAEAITGDAV